MEFKRAAPAKLFALAVAATIAVAAPAAAFDFFGLWPSADVPPPASENAISYSVTFSVDGAGSDVSDALRNASTLYGLRNDPPPDGDSLALRAQRDFAPLVDAMWAYGYFNASLTTEIDGVALSPSGDSAGFARAAEGYRNRAPAPIRIVVAAGPLFRLRTIEVLGPDGKTPIPESETPARVIGLKPGDPAAADAVRASERRVVDNFRAQSRPLAKVVAVRPVVDHAADAMDVTMIVDPGPVAGVGDIRIEAPGDIPDGVIRSFVYVSRGDAYSPEALERTKMSVQSIPAVGSARFVEKTSLDPEGDLPMDLVVGDRPAHAFGVSAQYSTIDGPLGQVYWEDRNLFGGAEYLRLEGDLLYAPATLGSTASAGSLDGADLGGRVSAHFIKPALADTQNDLLIDAKAERVGQTFGSLVGYTVDDIDVSAAIRHRFSDQLSLQAGLELQKGFATNAQGTIDYTLIGAPLGVNYDTTNDRLDPTRGVRASAQFAAYPKFMGSSLNLFTYHASIATYRAIDDASRFVLAGRIEAGGEFGAALDDIPANLRLYAGGGGSVRGYPYYSLGPLSPSGAVIGGRSVFDGSLELRARVTDTIGLVPFFDAGDAFASSWPDFSAPLRMSAGLGLRYYTSFGPLRVDLATPVNRRPGDPRFAIYVSIGQAF